MTSAGWSDIRWARNVPTVVREDGRPDHVAHLVLHVLATYADKNGHARPSLHTLADDCRMTPRATSGALSRLQTANLINQAGTLTGGVVVWALNLDAKRDQDDAESRRETARQRTAERVRRHRERKTGNAVRQRYVTPCDDVTVTPCDGVTQSPVTPCDSVTDDPVTPCDDVRNAVRQRYVTPPPPLQPQVTPATTAIGTTNELPIKDELPPGADAPGARAPASVPASRPAKPTKPASGYTPDFEAAWADYGRKGSKRNAATEWHKAIQRADPGLITVRARLYAQANPEFRYRKDFERWLRGDCWDAAIVPNQANATTLSTTDQRVGARPGMGGKAQAWAELGARVQAEIDAGSGLRMIEGGSSA